MCLTTQFMNNIIIVIMNFMISFNYNNNLCRSWQHRIQLYFSCKCTVQLFSTPTSYNYPTTHVRTTQLCHTRLAIQYNIAVLSNRTAQCQRLPEPLQELKIQLNQLTKFNVRCSYMAQAIYSHGNVFRCKCHQLYRLHGRTQCYDCQCITPHGVSFWLVQELKNERVRWFTDDQNVVCILQHGSRQFNLQAEILGTFLHVYIIFKQSLNRSQKNRIS